MNAVLDRSAEWCESLDAPFEPNDVRLRDRTVNHSTSTLLQIADGVVSTIVACAVLLVSVGFSTLMVAAMLVVLLCGLACYS